MFVRQFKTTLHLALCAPLLLALVSTISLRAVATSSLFGIALISMAQDVSAQTAFVQVPLTEDQIKSFIAADADVAAITAKIPDGVDKPDEATTTLLNAASRKHGFKDFDDYLNIASNIAAVLAGLDPETGEYSNPMPSLEKQIAAARADKQMTASERDGLIAELEDLKKLAVELEHKANIPLVQKYRNALAAMQ